MKPINRIRALSGGCFLVLGMSLPLLYSSHATAGFYKCIDGDGNTTYSQRPCPADERTDKIISSGGGSSSQNDCRIARHFMAKTAKQMLRGQSSGAVFDQYGGIDSIPRTSVALINYVYTFQYNHSVTAERITALSVARCNSGSFGATTCDDFPYSYIDQLGGCDQAALGPNYGRSHAAEGNQEDEENSAGGRRAVQNSAAGLNYGNQAGLNASQAIQKKKIHCVTRIQAKLASVSNKMRNGGSAARQDSLRAERRSLQKQLSSC